MSRYPYAEHDNGIVLTQPRPGEFERRPMTTAELEAREPALKITKDIYRHATQAGVCYFEIWKLIADAVDAGIAKAARPEVAEVGAQIRHEAARYSWLKAHWDEFTGLTWRDPSKALDAAIDARAPQLPKKDGST